MRSARSRSKIKKDSAVLQRFRGFSPDTGDDGARSRTVRGKRQRHSGSPSSPSRRTDRRLGCRNGGGQRGKAAARKRLRAERRQERGKAAGTWRSGARDGGKKKQGQNEAPKAGTKQSRRCRRIKTKTGTERGSERGRSARARDDPTGGGRNAARQGEAGGSTMAPQRAVTGNRPQAATGSNDAGNGQHRHRARRSNEQAATNEGRSSIRRMRRRVYRNLYERRRSSGPAPVPCCDTPASSGSGPNYRPASDGRPNIRRALAEVTAATSSGVVPLIAAIRSQTNRT